MKFIFMNWLNVSQIFLYPYHSEICRLDLKHELPCSSQMTCSDCSANNLHIAIFLSNDILVTNLVSYVLAYFWVYCRYFCDSSLMFGNQGIILNSILFCYFFLSYVCSIVFCHHLLLYLPYQYFDLHHISFLRLGTFF